jgi:hypothetical protein
MYDKTNSRFIWFYNNLFFKYSKLYAYVLVNPYPANVENMVSS